VNLPFTTEQFLRIFAEYNREVWPAQIFLYVIAALALFLSLKRHASSGKLISIILAFLWLWVGVVYHLAYFSAINKAAFVFGAFSILQAGLFIHLGVLKSRLRFRPHSDLYGLTGALIIAFALVLYPLISHYLGHRYPNSPTFGLPCPTTIFTFGMLLWAEGRVPLSLILIPLVWSILGFVAALSMTMTEDYGLVIAGLIGTSMIIARNRKRFSVQTKIRATS
jgi:hypothetical protein